ncbi:MAG: hypothetical protein CL846_10605 [Crocinitomicaceae bacterium]|nr:hypothetical protein [Crocinitomicaceae bacterium]|tara:strand:- start:7563 stop:8348 length:786 start_codon:yes stop_codon:yes gene_type:complete
MEIIEHLFFLGIVYIIFNIIWGIIVLFPKLLVVGLSSNTSLDYSIKIIRYLLISTLTYSSGLNFISENNIKDQQSPWIFILGGAILALYLAGKLNKRKSILNMTTMVMGNLNKSPIKQKNLVYEPHIIGLSIIAYALCIAVPKVGVVLGENAINHWFLDTIKDIYDTPFLGWIFGIAGVFFLLSMFQKGVLTIQKFINSILGKPSSDKKENDNPLKDIMDQFENLKTDQNPFKKDQNKVDIDDDLYVDFEEVNEDEETKNK